MSGLVALFDPAGIERALLEQMHDEISHRGPDGDRLWGDRTVGFGYQQLESTPEAAYDTQPYSKEGTSIVADVRLDNRSELLRRLSTPESLERIPDSLLVLSAYRRWGLDCVEQLYGSFAFVIHDRHENRLFCARDRFGVKPLYYRQEEGQFAAASEIKALLCLPTVTPTVDDTKIGDFLSALYEDRERTFFESIHRVPPSHAMTVDLDGTNCWEYWDLDPTRTLTLDSDRAYERRFRELLEQAVGSRLRAAGNIGTTLSGGLDSSSITVLTRDLLPDSERLQTFSNVYEEAPSSDEREFIETITCRDGIEPNYLFLDETPALVDEEQFRECLDQPPHNTMHFAVWERAKCAAAEDVSVVLGGALGDSAIGYGLGLLPELFWKGRWWRLSRELQSMGEVLDAPARHLFVRHVLRNLLPEPAAEFRRALMGETNSVVEENPTLDASFVDEVGLQKRYDELPLSGGWSMPRARVFQYRSLRTGRTVTNFEAMDLVYALFGVEPRYPFTDARLVEFTLAIPPTQQLANGWTRSIVRRAVDDLLPEKIQWRPWKTSTNEAFWNALSHEERRLREMAADPGPLARYVDAEALTAARKRFEAEPTSRDGRVLWRALSLSVWLDEFATA